MAEIQCCLRCVTQLNVLANQDAQWQTIVNVVLINELQGFCKTVASQSNQSAFCPRKWLTDIDVVFYSSICVQHFDATVLPVI